MQTRSEVVFGLSGTLWPVHLKPQPDELLSSWIVRLSHAHGYKVQTMCAILFGQGSAIWSRDIDRSAPPEIGEILVQATGAAAEQIEGTTLRAYEGWLFERHNPNGLTRWLVPLGIFHRVRKRLGLMFCSQCLMEDAEPYFRRRWRLALSMVCARHGCYLQDACPECVAPLALHRTDMQGRQYYPRAGSIAHCWKCGFDLRDSPQEDRPDEALVRFQARLDAALQCGYVDWAGNPSMHSLVFFDGLRALIAGLMSFRTWERLTGPTRMHGIDLGCCPKMGLEMASLQMRRELFSWLAVLLDDWPANFGSLIRENNLRYADLKGDSACRPFWYEEVIRREARGGFALISQDEANAIAAAAETKYGRFSGTSARKLSGRDISAHVADRKVRPVSDEVYEDLLTSIDHQVAGTLDKTERACLIRDKVMFAVGRQLQLSESALADLTLERVREIVPNADELSFVEVAKSPGQARAWVEWFWEKMRPQLQPREGMAYVFTSPRTRRGFKRSTVGARLQRAVDVAVLRRSIPRYGRQLG